MKKIILSIVGCLSVLLMATGCNKNNAVDKMVGYMNEKYVEDNFTFQKVYGGHLGDNDTKIIVSSEKFPNSEIKVICYDSGECTDNYLDIKYEEQTSNYLKNELSKEFGNKVYVKYVASDRSCYKNGSSYTTFEEYIANECSGIYFSTIIGYNVNDNTEDITLSKIKNAFSNITVIADIFFVNENISSLNYDTYDEFVAYIQDKKYNKKLYIIKENVNTYSTIEWNDN